jgi:hypothetical protein
VILVNSCGWIEFLVDGEMAGEYEQYFQESLGIATPTIVI